MNCRVWRPLTQNLYLTFYVGSFDRHCEEGVAVIERTRQFINDWSQASGEFTELYQPIDPTDRGRSRVTYIFENNAKITEFFAWLRRGAQWVAEQAGQDNAVDELTNNIADMEISSDSESDQPRTDLSSPTFRTLVGIDEVD